MRIGLPSRPSIPTPKALAAGAAAGAAGVTALNTVTYLDMALRGRPASDTPERSVEALTEKMPLSIPGDEDTRQNRLLGLGPLTGVAAGVTVGAAMGLLRSAGRSVPVWAAGPVAALAAMAAGDGPMAALGVTDPRSWSLKDWVSDVVPHLAFGFTAAWTLDAIVTRRPRPGRRDLLW